MIDPKNCVMPKKCKSVLDGVPVQDEAFPLKGNRKPVTVEVVTDVKIVDGTLVLTKKWITFPDGNVPCEIKDIRDTMRTT